MEQFDEIFDDNHCQNQEDETVQEETANLFTDLGESYSKLVNEAKNSVVIVKLKKINGHILQRYLKTKTAKSNLLKNLIENHARAELYPNIKEPVTLPNGTIM